MRGIWLARKEEAASLPPKSPLSSNEFAKVKGVDDAQLARQKASARTAMDASVQVSHLKYSRTPGLYWQGFSHQLQRLHWLELLLVACVAISPFQQLRNPDSFQPKLFTHARDKNALELDIHHERQHRLALMI
jgi:hypothetical protein